mmetsp:Transcript_74463/g.199033  ORF Transcript_74463/g.199033 Transcript_74463/m.199033 type:complete len:254 (-) Transcript_74463:1087-1848(-)
MLKTLSYHNLLSLDKSRPTGEDSREMTWRYVIEGDTLFIRLAKNGFRLEINPYWNYFYFQSNKASPSRKLCLNENKVVEGTFKSNQTASIQLTLEIGCGKAVEMIADDWECSVFGEWKILVNKNNKQLCVHLTNQGFIFKFNDDDAVVVSDGAISHHRDAVTVKNIFDHNAQMAAFQERDKIESSDLDGLLERLNLPLQIREGVSDILIREVVGPKQLLSCINDKELEEIGLPESACAEISKLKARVLALSSP